MVGEGLWNGNGVPHGTGTPHSNGLSHMLPPSPLSNGLPHLLPPSPLGSLPELPILELSLPDDTPPAVHGAFSRERFPSPPPLFILDDALRDPLHVPLTSAAAHVTVQQPPLDSVPQEAGRLFLHKSQAAVHFLLLGSRALALPSCG